MALLASGLASFFERSDPLLDEKLPTDLAEA